MSKEEYNTMTNLYQLIVSFKYLKDYILIVLSTNKDITELSYKTEKNWTIFLKLTIKNKISDPQK